MQGSSGDWEAQVVLPPLHCQFDPLSLICHDSAQLPSCGEEPQVYVV